MVMLVALLLAGVPLSAWAAPAPSVPANPLSLVKRAEAHEVERMFSKRQTNYPASNAIPPDSSIPKAWLDKLATVNLPSDVPVSTGTPLPAYGSRSKSDPTICSFTYECTNPEDLYAPPPGHISFTIDDGISGGSDALRDYLTSVGGMGKATHFMIGSYIAGDPNKFKGIAEGGAHIGVHTWSHNYMTTLTNNQVVAELGWSMQIIADNNGGRIPRFWRPPFGDVDNRVRAIAKGVFGLETVVWNYDTGDWNLDQGNSYTVSSVIDAYTKRLGDKSTGINVLEHEVRPSQVEVFRTIFARAQQMGWVVGNVADIWGQSWYQNSQTGNSTVTPMSVGAAAVIGANSTASASASASSSASSSMASSSSANSTSISSTLSASPTASSTSTSTSATGSLTNQNAAASATASKAAAASRIQAAALGLVIPVVGLVVAVI